MGLKYNHLRRFRQQKGLSQEELSKIVKVTRQTIISIENGRYTPSLELALRFAITFNCKVEDIFGI